jgi:putative phosphoribosyl transferase
MSQDSCGFEEVSIPVGPTTLHGLLRLPDRARGLVVFVHGSGSSRFSPRNRFVARSLNDVGLATLLFDLLTPFEEAEDLETRRFRFDTPRLADRLEEMVRWLGTRPVESRLPLGLFGASTGAAAALIAAARDPGRIRSVVSRGGRPDLADAHLARVRAPTLFIVGGEDHGVIALNLEAAARMEVKPHLAIVPGATHLFEEPGSLAEAARLATDWFLETLAPERAHRTADTPESAKGAQRRG